MVAKDFYTLYNLAMSNSLTHVDNAGNLQMVDVGNKPVSIRIAQAKGEITMSMDTFKTIKEGNVKKGDVLAVAKVAGIMAAKRTSELIPLCHPIPLSNISVDLIFDESLPGILIFAEVKSTAQTGVEMEALTAVSLSALTVYDMAKALDKSMCIQNIRLVKKSGGVHGDFDIDNQSR